MTTISSPTSLSTTPSSTASPSTTAGKAGTRSADRPLRLVLRANAASSLAFGLVGAIGARYWSDVLGFDHTALTVAVSLGLLVFGADVLWVSGRPASTMGRAALAISVADLTWVAATVAAVAGGILTTAGVVVAVVAGLAVLDFAFLQLWLRRRIT